MGETQGMIGFFGIVLIVVIMGVASLAQALRDRDKPKRPESSWADPEGDRFRGPSDRG